MTNLSNLRLRLATEADLAAIMRIEHACFGSDSWSEANMHLELVAHHTSYWVATAESERFGDQEIIAGYAGLSHLALSPQCDVQTIAVSSEFRGLGLGRRLMNQLISTARLAGASEMFLEVRADNPVALRLYESLGFEQIDLRRGYYQPDGVDAIVMRADLGVEGGQSAGANFSAVSEPIVLGIESSCDETGVGIVRGTTLLANVIATSMDEHARFGGVVPEIAARAHLEALQPTLHAALSEAQLGFEDIDAIAVTNGPGLSGALMVGVGAAKALSVALDKPIYAVNHLVGHVGVDILERGELQTPTIALLVSGGHTSLLLVNDLLDDVVLLGETIDDAAGEAFDKIARIMGLRYPGGPEIDRAAKTGDPNAVRFPRGLTLPKDLVNHRYDFSFSGLKTAVARHIEVTENSQQAALSDAQTADIAASFREAVVDVLVSKAVAACLDHNVPRLLLGGGVVANARLRELAAERCATNGIELRIPAFKLCTDNGAMIAALGAQLMMAGREPSALDFGVDSTLPVTTVQS